MKEDDIKISRMSCKHCEKAVENALCSLQGIKKVEVDLQGGKASVSYDDTKVSLKDIQACIKDAGYGVSA